MSNDKRIIEKLAKIVENQQKIINKLAEEVGLTSGSPPSTGVHAPPAQKLDPNATDKKPAQHVLDALPSDLKGHVAALVEKAGVNGLQFVVTFKQGQATQKNLDAVTAVVQKLINSNVIQQAHTVTVG
jgi:hypothetical protein